MKPIDVAGEWSDWTDDETISMDVKKTFKSGSIAPHDN